MSERTRNAVLALAVAALAVLAFLPALLAPRASVDPDDVLKNPMIGTPRNAPALFGPGLLFYTEGQYRPLGYVVLSLGRTLARPEATRFWVAWLVAFHVASALLVFAIARRLARNPAAALVAAALYAAHPIASLYAGDVARFPFLLGGTLSLASLACYLRHARSRGLAALAASVALFGAAALTSKAAWALPPIVLVFELAWERRRVVPALAVLAPFAVVALATLALGAAVRPHPIRFEYPSYPIDAGWISFYTFVGDVPRAVTSLVLGTGFQAPPGEIAERIFSPVHVRFIPVSCLALVLAAFAVYELARRRWVALGILFALLGVLPFASLAWNRVTTPVSWDGWQAGAIGLAFVVGALADALFTSPSPALRVAARVAAGAYVAAFALLLARENVARRDPVAYWTHVLDVNPHSELASRHLGAALLDAGDRAGAMRALFSPAVNDVPRSALVAGLGYLRDNEPLAGIVHFHRAQRFEDPEPFTRNRIVLLAARLTLAVNGLDYAEASAARARLADPWSVDALCILAESLRRKGFLRAARRHAEEALRIVPDDREAASLLHRIREDEAAPPSDEPRILKPPSPEVLEFLVGGRRGRALCERVIPLADARPDDPLLQLESGMCLLSLGQTEPARERLKAVAGRLPQHPYLWASERASDVATDVAGAAVSPDASSRTATMWSDMGYLLYQRGELTEAVACFRAAIEADPKIASAHNSLGLVLTVQGKADDAIACYRAAVALAPANPEPYRNLASALLGKRDYAEALRVLESAAAVAPADRDVKLRLAWLLATAPEGALRSGTRAVKLAEEALASGERRPANDFAVLAAALAEAGDFDRAVAVARDAAARARAERTPEVARAIEDRLRSYERRLPWRMK